MVRRSMVMVAVLLFGLALARADEDANTAQAKQHYLSGMAHFNLQEYTQAITEFEAAYRLKPDAVFLYNLAQAHRLNHNVERALYFYQAYLRASPDAPNRAEVEGRIATLEKLQSDQKSLATPPDHTIAPGEKTPSSSATPAPIPAPAASVPASAKAEPEAERTPVYKKWWLWTIVGVVAAGAAVGIAVGLTQSSPSFNAGLGTVGPAALGVAGGGQTAALRVRY